MGRIAIVICLLLLISHPYVEIIGLSLEKGTVSNMDRLIRDFIPRCN